MHVHPDTAFLIRLASQRQCATRPSASRRPTGPIRYRKHSSTAGGGTPLGSASPPAGSVAALVGVTLLWGTYTPALRALFSLDASVSPQAVTACRAVISAGALLAASAVAAIGSRRYKAQLVDAVQPEQAAGEVSENQQRDEQARPGSDRATAVTSSSTADANAWGVAASGLELGLWNFLGTSSQAIGIELTTASKAAILTQLVAVLTPCLAWLSGQSVLPIHWACCLVALVGSCLITLDDTKKLRQQEQQKQQATCNSTESPNLVSANHNAVAGDAMPSDGLPSSSSASNCSGHAWGRALDVLPNPATSSSSSSSSSTSSSSSSSSNSDGASSFQVLADPDAATHSSVQQAWQEQPLQPTLMPPTHGPYAGESYVLLGCMFYALATVRLGVHAPRHNSLQLAASKTLSQAAAAITWLLMDGAAPNHMTSEAAAGAASGTLTAAAWQLPSALSHGTGLLLLLYSALGPGALAAFLQAKGQAGVPPVQAQVVFSLTPVWAILLAAATLRGEELSPVACLGASIVIAASVVAAFGYRSSSMPG